MDRDYWVRVTAWVDSLTDEQRAEAHAVTGVLPEWMVDGLHAAGVEPAHAEMTVNGVVVAGMLMPTAVREALDRHHVS